MRTPLCDRLGIRYPIFAFSAAPKVVAAVSRAGGLGVLGAVGYNVEQLRAAMDEVEAHADGKPYGVDIVLPAKYVSAGSADAADYEKYIPAQHRAFLEGLLEKHQVPKLPDGQTSWHALLAWTEETSRPQVELVLERNVALLASALGAFPEDIIEAAHAKGMLVAAMTGSVKHALKQVAAGVDIIVAQGTEAGGHCGEIASMVLVPEVVDAVGDVPVLAAGGIGCGRQAAAALALGAQGIWTGSIWLTAAESDVKDVLKQKLLNASSSDTVRSKALTGKPARQLRTAWSDAWDAAENPDPLPVPLHFVLTAEATTRIHQSALANPEGPGTALLTSPVGQIVGRMQSIEPAEEIVARLVREFGEAARHIAQVAG
jgi:NAD(P)H-dependent flavin oxidoreductase YrpB (nitropropane dioxygenase family)